MHVKQLTKKMNKKTVFSNLSFSLKRGEIVGLIGRNGTGKTTLFRTISQMYQADQGEVTLAGENSATNGHARSKVFFLDEQMKYFKKYRLQEIGEDYAAFYEHFDFEVYRNLVQEYGFKDQDLYGTCSKGRQRLIDFILAIASNADYILLDEPFDGLDLLIRKQVIQLLLEHVTNQQVGILIASHNIQELETLIERVLFLKNGKIVEDQYLNLGSTTTKKFQFVFQQSKVPALLKERGRILAVQGRVIVCLFHDVTPELMASIEAHQPVLFEELPVRLEDLYLQHFVKEKDYQLFQ